MAKTTWQKQHANYKYGHKVYDYITVYVPKVNKVRLKALAEEQGISLSRYIIEAVEQRSGLKLTLDGVFEGGDKRKKKQAATE